MTTSTAIVKRLSPLAPARRARLMRELRLLERQREAFQMKMAGLTYEEIAKENNCSAMMARRDIQIVTDRITEETEALAERYRAMENFSIDVLRKEILPVATMNFRTCEHLTDLEKRRLQQGAWREWDRSMVRRAKLMGLDKQVDNVGDSGGSDRPYRSLSDAELAEKRTTLQLAVGVQVVVKKDDE